MNWWPYLLAFLIGGSVGILVMALMSLPSKQPSKPSPIQRTYSAHPIDGDTVTGTG